MRISSSTNSHEKNLWSDQIIYPCQDAICALRQAGFQAVDINFHSYSLGDEPMTKDDWRTWCFQIRHVADENGVCISQAHAPFYGLRSDGTESPENRALMERAIEGAHICGVKQMVFHPFDVRENGWYSQQKSKEYNLRLFSEYAEICHPYNISIAIENMIENPGRNRRYCSAEDELIDLVDTLNDPLIGICWDFGHANMNGVNQTAALKKIGKRLIALHVNDNGGKYDDHIAPYLGTIQWEPILSTLKEIGYDGDWTYEIHNFFNGQPDALQSLALRYSYELAQYMVSLAE